MSQIYVKSAAITKSYILVASLLSGCLTFMWPLLAKATKPPLKIGINRPETGPYARIGLDQERAAQLAADEINNSGGILGRRVELLMADSQSKPDVSEANVRRFIDTDQVLLITGGASSGVAKRVAEVCQQQQTLYMTSIAAANEMTGSQGHRHSFRTGYSAWMGAKALGTYLKTNFANKRVFYIVADYSWGRSAETSIRHFSSTEDSDRHVSTYTTFPGATDAEIRNKILLAKARRAEVLVLALFGNDVARALRFATELGIKKDTQIVIALVELSVAEGAGPEAMDGVIGASDWNWRVPYDYDYARGKTFVENFRGRFGRYPCWGAATTYTNLWQYKSAAERAGSVDAKAVIRALEAHRFVLLKDEQHWRDFDHQNVQTVYLVRGRAAAEVKASDLEQNYFENIAAFNGQELVPSLTDWQNNRRAANLPLQLERFANEH